MDGSDPDGENQIVLGAVLSGMTGESTSVRTFSGHCGELSCLSPESEISCLSSESEYLFYTISFKKF